MNKGVQKKFWGNDGYFNWWALRPVGNIPALKVSYAVLFLIPIAARFEARVVYVDLLSWPVFLAYFSSLSLAVANLLFDVRCPTVVKRFASSNDLYHEMLKIKTKSKSIYPDDKFDASLDHCKKFYDGLSDKENVFAGKSCAVLFLTAAILFGALVLERLFQVIHAAVT